MGDYVSKNLVPFQIFRGPNSDPFALSQIFHALSFFSLFPVFSTSSSPILMDNSSVSSFPLSHYLFVLYPTADNQDLFLFGRLASFSSSSLFTPPARWKGQFSCVCILPSPPPPPP